MKWARKIKCFIGGFRWWSTWMRIRSSTRWRHHVVRTWLLLEDDVSSRVWSGSWMWGVSNLENSREYWRLCVHRQLGWGAGLQREQTQRLYQHSAAYEIAKPEGTHAEPGAINRRKNKNDRSMKCFLYLAWQADSLHFTLVCVQLDVSLLWPCRCSSTGDSTLRMTCEWSCPAHFTVCSASASFWVITVHPRTLKLFSRENWHIV